VNVGSIGGRYTFPLMGAYNSTKYAVESLSDALRNELAPALARRPRVRYVPRAAALLLALLAILPTRLVDFVLQRASGLTRKNLEQGKRLQRLSAPAA
jgi:NAD(P)-dependent dehydrogenase (short-subunit alcohol dehydrogenase family)